MLLQTLSWTEGVAAAAAIWPLSLLVVRGCLLLWGSEKASFSKLRSVVRTCRVSVAAADVSEERCCCRLPKCGCVRMVMALSASMHACVAAEGVVVVDMMVDRWMDGWIAVKCMKIACACMYILLVVSVNVGARRGCRSSMHRGRHNDLIDGGSARYFFQPSLKFEIFQQSVYIAAYIMTRRKTGTCLE